MSQSSKPRLLIADDHTLVLEGIRKLLENDVELVGTVEDGRALLPAVEQLQPDVILLDISLPLLNGIEACRQLMKIMPKARIIFLTMHADVVYVEEALRAGGMGYLLKRSAASELKAAIEAVMHGRRYITPLISWKHVAGDARPQTANESSSDKLTPRQREVLQLVAEGRSNKEIAALLHVSEKTIDFHKSAIKRQLMMNSTAELTQFAIKHRIIGT
jgi:DNA-binding NarL/FixJ family response regulator